MNTPLSHRLVLFVVAFVMLGQFLLPTITVFAQANPSNAYVPYNGNPPQPEDFGFGNSNPPPAAQNSNAGQTPGGSVTGSTGGVSGGGATAGGPTPANAYVPNNGQSMDEGNGMQVSTFLDLIGADMYQKTYYLLIMAGGWFANLGGAMFDLAFNEFVMKFSCYLTTQCDGGGGQVGGVIDNMWMLIRDLFNIVFIFALVWIGLRLILDSNETGTQKAVGMLIAAALLVNFSLYVGKLVIDIANYTAVQVYETMVSGLSNDFSVTLNNENNQNPELGTQTINLIDTGEQSISGAFMQVLVISSFFSDADSLGEGMQIVLLGLIAFIFLLYLMFVLLYGAIMVIGRFVALIFLLIFSPLMLIGWVLPQFEKYGKQWWQNFIAYSFFIPLYVFLIYISLYVLIQITPILNDAGGYATTIQTGEDWSVFLLFFIGAGMLYASTKASAMLSKQGTTIGLQAGSNIARKVTTGFAGGLTAYGAGYGATSAWGRIGKSFVNDADRVEAATGKASSILRYQRKIGEKMYGQKVAGTSLKDRRDERDAANKRASGTYQMQKVNDAISNYDSSKKEDTDRIKMERAVARASNSQLEGIKAKTLAEPHVAGALTDSQFEAIQKSDKFSDTDKATIAEGRQKAVISQLSENTDKNDLSKIDKASVSQLTTLGGEKLSEPKVAAKLTSSQMDDLKKKLTETEFTNLVKERNTGLENQGTSVFSGRKNKDIAKLPDTILEKTENIAHLVKEQKLSGDLLGNIARESNINKREFGKKIVKAYSDEKVTMPEDVKNFLLNGNGHVFGVSRQQAEALSKPKPEIPTAANSNSAPDNTT